jgi:hypothetical protein
MATKPSALFLRHGSIVKTLSTTVSVKGVEIAVDYEWDGDFEEGGPVVHAAQINGAEVWPLFSDTKLGEQIERAVERRVRS